MLYALDLDSLPLPAARKIGITDLPVRLLTDKILPFCEVKDILSLGCTSKFFAVIMSGDGEFWRRKLAIDYNFTGSETNRTSGWKFVYLRLGRPRFFAWGCVRFSSVLLRGRPHICWSTHAPAKHNNSERSSDLRPRILQRWHFWKPHCRLKLAWSINRLSAWQ